MECYFLYFPRHFLLCASLCASLSREYASRVIHFKFISFHSSGEEGVVELQERGPDTTKTNTTTT